MSTPTKSSWIKECLAVLACFAISMTGAIPANGATRMVLLEKFSVTWCPHCMATASALDDLLEDHGDRFIPLEIFSTTASGGRYQIPWGRSRALDFYRVPGYPTAWFDGTVNRLGDADAYAAYLGRVNARLAIPTDVLVGLSATRTGDRTYAVTASVGLEPTGIPKTVRVSMVEALDHFGVFDDNTTIPRNTLKHVLEGGFDVALTPGQTTLVTRTITLDDDSLEQFEDIRLIAWAQTPAASGPAEVFNASQFSLSDTIAGDFDGNGIVDGADLNDWKGAFGRTGAADANGDSVSDGSDLLAWQRTLGNSRPPAAAPSTPIPEPTTPMLLAASIVLFATFFRSREVARRFGREASDGPL
jgi:hypothetical protein